MGPSNCMMRGTLIPSRMPDCFYFGDVTVDSARFQVSRSGEVLSLEPRAVHVLLHLLQNPGRLVTKEEIFAAVWGETFVTDNALARIIAQLRKALGDSSREPRYIETVPTLGYRFIGVLADTEASRPLPPVRPRVPRWVFAAAGLVAVAVIFLAWMPGSRPVPQPQVNSVRQFTTGLGLDAGGSFSPDGSSFAYSSDRTGQFEIYTRLLNEGGDERQVTNDAGQNVYPKWSPDGTWIAYESAARGGICVIPSTGGQPRRLTAFGSQPDWSPDSQVIVFRSHGQHSFAPEDELPIEPTTLWLVPLSGGPPKPLTRPLDPPCFHSEPVFYRNGREVLFVCCNRFGPGASTSLYKVSIDGGPATALPAPKRFVLSPRISRDGTRLYFAGADNLSEFGVYELRFDNLKGTPRPLRTTGFRIPSDIAAAPNGSVLTFSERATESALWQVFLRSDGEPARPPAPLTKQSLRRASLPVFSPDGSRIAYSQKRAGSSGDIRIMNSDGTGEHAATYGPSQDGLASWTPDGSAVVFNSASPAGRRLVRLTLEGRSETVLSFPADVQRLARISPDGQSAASHRFDAGNLTTWITLLGTGSSSRLAPSVASAGFPVWSPDGRRVALEVFSEGSTMLGLASVSSPDAAPQMLITRPGQHWPWSWDPTGTKIALASREQGRWFIEWISIVNGHRRTLLLESSMRYFVRYPAWSPQGDRIVYERSETRGNIQLLTLSDASLQK